MNSRWHFYSPLGTFWIEPDQEYLGRWQLRIEHNHLGSYQTPSMAAQIVANQKTGFTAWDQVKGERLPSHLEDWQAE